MGRVKFVKFLGSLFSSITVRCEVVHEEKQAYLVTKLLYKCLGTGLILCEVRENLCCEC
jgi:hypothetical protein